MVTAPSVLVLSAVAAVASEVAAEELLPEQPASVPASMVPQRSSADILLSFIIQSSYTFCPVWLWGL